nr:hypothetical protein [Tanacetum cinerariifolium]
MSTHSSARNLFPPLDNPELTIQRRSRADPTLLNDFEMATEGNGDPPVLDLRAMEELCQPSLNGRGGPITSITIQATNFGLKNDMIQQSIKVNGVTDDALRLYLFPHSLTNHATAWFDHFRRNFITTFEQMAKMFLGKYFLSSMVTKLINEITNFRQRPDESLFEAWERYKLSIDQCPNHNMLPVTQIDTFYNGLTLRHRDTINATAGGTFMKRRPRKCYDLIENRIAHHNEWDTSAQRRANHGPNPPLAYQAPAYQAPGYQASVHQPPIPQPQVVATTEFTNYMKENDAILKNIQTNMTSLTNDNLKHKNMFDQFMKMNTASSLGSGTLPSNTITNPKEDLKGITTRSETAYQGPTIPTTSSSFPKVVERETEVIKDTMPPTNNGSTKDVQPPIVQIENPILNFEPVVVPVIEPIIAPDSDFLLEEVDAFLVFEDDPTSPKVNHSYFDTEGDILLLESFLNDDPSSTPPTQGKYLPQVRKELKICEAKNDKSSIDEPPEVELKDLPPHLEYAFLEGDDKLPVIISKDLGVVEKATLIKVLKSHKQAICHGVIVSTPRGVLTPIRTSHPSRV